jgi:hypothetical protein
LVLSSDKSGVRILLCNLQFLKQFLYEYYRVGENRRCRWLRRYATSRDVAGSIPDEVVGFLNCSNPVL